MGLEYECYGQARVDIRLFVVLCICNQLVTETKNYSLELFVKHISFSQTNIFFSPQVGIFLVFPSNSNT